MARRVLAPGPNSPALKAVLAELREQGAAIRALEVQLANAPMSKQAAIVARMNRIYTAREKTMSEWVRVTLPRVTGAGVRYIEAALGAPPRTSALLRRALEALQQATFAEVAASTTYLRADTKRLLQQIAKELTILHVERGLSIPEASRAIAARMRGIGVHAFRDRAGRVWRLESYSSMLARTRTAEAYNTGAILRGSELGVEAYEIFDGTGDPACAEANGRIVSAQWALDNQIEHPNCVRAFGPLPDQEAPAA